MQIAMMKSFALVALSAASASAALFAENFGEGWEDRWVTSTAKEGLGKFEASAGEYYNDEAADTGIKTSEDAKFYGLLAAFDEFSNTDKDLYVQVRRFLHPRTTSPISNPKPKKHAHHWQSANRISSMASQPRVCGFAGSCCRCCEHFLRT
jgi:hypothetical protein